MTTGETIHKLEYLKKSYQMLIDEKVDRGKLVGRDITGEWKADSPLDEAYKSMIEAVENAIKALEQENVLDKIRAEIKEWYWQADKQALAKDPCVVDAMVDLFIRTIDKYKSESEEE